jgi:hypothetical protein
MAYGSSTMPPFPYQSSTSTAKMSESCPKLVLILNNEWLNRRKYAESYKPESGYIDGYSEQPRKETGTFPSYNLTTPRIWGVGGGTDTTAILMGSVADPRTGAFLPLDLHPGQVFWISHLGSRIQPLELSKNLTKKCLYLYLQKKERQLVYFIPSPFLLLLFDPG